MQVPILEEQVTLKFEGRSDIVRSALVERIDFLTLSRLINKDINFDVSYFIISVLNEKLDPLDVSEL